MFDVSGLWLMKHLLGELTLPGKDAMDQDWRQGVARLESLKDAHEQIQFQTYYVMDLAKDCGNDYPYNVDISDIFEQ